MNPSAMTIKDLHAYVGGLSNPSKMPCFGYSLPAKECNTGSKLRKVKGSTCSGCYAFRGNYLYPKIQQALYFRLEALSKPFWVEVIAELITRKSKNKTDFFRWHDSGDLQSVDHLRMICRVAELTPHIKHWLPTREYRIVGDFRREGGIIPENLNIRMSAHMVGGITPSFTVPLTISTVSKSDDVYPTAHSCPSRFQDNFCGDCRACWNPEVVHVDYHAH